MVPWSGNSVVFVAQSPRTSYTSSERIKRNSGNNKESNTGIAAVAAICDIKTGTTGMNQLISINKAGVVQIWQLNNAIDSKSINGIKQPLQDKKKSVNSIAVMLQFINNVFEIDYFDMIQSFPSNSNLVIHDSMDQDLTIADDSITNDTTATTAIGTKPVENKKPMFGFSSLFGLKESSNHNKNNKHEQIMEDLNSFPSDAICFHPSITLLGRNPSFLVGTCGGDIIKFNMDYMSSSSSSSSGMDASIIYPISKAFVDYEYLHPSSSNNNNVNSVPKGFVLSGKPEERKGNRVSREIFHFHKDKIILLEVLDKLSDTVLSMDQSGKIALWKYCPDCLQAINWFRPISTIALLLQTQELMPRSIDDDAVIINDDAVDNMNNTSRISSFTTAPSMKIQKRLRVKEVLNEYNEEYECNVIQTIYHPIYSKKRCAWVQYSFYKHPHNEGSSNLESNIIETSNETHPLDNSNQVLINNADVITGIINSGDSDNVDEEFPVRSEIILESDNSINKINNTKENEFSESHDDVLQNNIKHTFVDPDVLQNNNKHTFVDPIVQENGSNIVENTSNIIAQSLDESDMIENALNEKSVLKEPNDLEKSLIVSNTVESSLMGSDTVVSLLNESQSNKSSENVPLSIHSNDNDFNQVPALDSILSNNMHQSDPIVAEPSLNESTNVSEKSLKASDSVITLVNENNNSTTEDTLNLISDASQSAVTATEPLNRTSVKTKNNTNNIITSSDDIVSEVDDATVVELDSLMQSPPDIVMMDSLPDCSIDNDILKKEDVETWSAIELNKVDLDMTIVTNKLSSDGSELFLLLAARYSEYGRQVYNRVATTSKEFSIIYYLMTYHVVKQQFHRPYPRLMFDKCKLDPQGSVNIVLDFAVGPISHETLTRMAFILTIYAVDIYSLYTGKRVYMFDWRIDIPSFAPTKIDVCVSQRVVSLSADADDVRIAVWIIHHKLDGLDTTATTINNNLVEENETGSVVNNSTNKLDNSLESRFESMYEQNGIITLDYLRNRIVKTILAAPVLEVK